MTQSKDTESNDTVSQATTKLMAQSKDTESNDTSNQATTKMMEQSKDTESNDIFHQATTKMMAQSKDVEQQWAAESFIRNFYSVEQYPWLNFSINQKKNRLNPERILEKLHHAKDTVSHTMESILQPTEEQKIIFSEESAWLPVPEKNEHN